MPVKLKNIDVFVFLQKTFNMAKKENRYDDVFEEETPTFGKKGDELLRWNISRHMDRISQVAMYGGDIYPLLKILDAWLIHFRDKQCEREREELEENKKTWMKKELEQLEELENYMVTPRDKMKIEDKIKRLYTERLNYILSSFIARMQILSLEMKSKDRIIDRKAL